MAMALAEGAEFRLFLQAEIASRCSGNPEYSLRAFAKSLDIDHSTLSQLVRGKRRMTVETIDRLCARLGVDEARTAAFKSEALMNTREIPAAAYDAIVQLAQDAAHLLSEWTGFGILELLRLREFRPDSRWIANVLGVTADEVNVALQRLLRVGLLEMTDRARWRDRSREAEAAGAGQPLATIVQLLEQVRRLTSVAARCTRESGPTPDTT